VDKTDKTKKWCDAVSIGRVRLLARLPRRRLTPQAVAAAVNVAAGVSGDGEGAARAFPDGRVSIAVTASGQVFGVVGRHIITAIMEKDNEITNIR
jgi:hypothetical protein